MPDPQIKALDLLPRIELIEDLFFTKKLPKKYKLFKYEMPFSEKIDRIKDPRKHLQALNHDSIKTIETNRSQQLGFKFNLLKRVAKSKDGRDEVNQAAEKAIFNKSKSLSIIKRGFNKMHR